LGGTTGTTGTATGAACSPPAGTSVALEANPTLTGVSPATWDAGLAEGISVTLHGPVSVAIVGWDLPSPQNFSDAGAFGLTFENPGATDVSIAIELVDDGGVTSSQRGSGLSAAGTTQTYALSFTDPATLGIQALPPYAGCVPTLYAPTFPQGFGSSIAAVNVHFSPSAQGIMAVGDPVLWPAPQTFEGLVDGFGQYTGRDWPGKANMVADLQGQAAAEAPSLALDGGGLGLDAFGGTTLVPPSAASGYFYVQQDSDGGFWLVDPIGNLFFSVGMDSISPQGGTAIAGREAMFTSVPDGGPFAHDEDGIFGPVSSGETYDFIFADAALKYGVADPTQVVFDTALRRLWAWGFNTVGAWSATDFVAASGFTFSTRVPYVLDVTPGGGSTKIEVDGQGMPDPYDPAFATDLATALAQPQLAGAVTDPYLIGYYVQNELPWEVGSGTAAQFGVPLAVLATDGSTSTAYAKQAFLAALQSEYATIADLNSAWGTSYASFAALIPPITLPAQLTPAAQADLEALGLAFAGQYFSTVQAQLRAFDPNHLYLGAKFSDYSPEALEACAEYCDVISFDEYAHTLETFDGLSAYPKPAIIAEHSFGAADRGLFWGGEVPVGSQADRGAAYAAYQASVLANRQFVGSHWFKYWDAPVLGDYLHGSNDNQGFIAVTDEPYPELVAAARTANAAVYATRLGL
jgi:hypothetical protein